ncbi:MAG: hypothetical protein ABIA74_05675 [bacterium]
MKFIKKVLFCLLFLSFPACFSIPRFIILPNISAQSCYMNSVLQILLRNKDLNNILLENKNDFRDSPIKDYIDFYIKLDEQVVDEIDIKNNQVLFNLLKAFFDESREVFKNKLHQSKSYMGENRYGVEGGTAEDFYQDFLEEMCDKQSVKLCSDFKKKYFVGFYSINSKTNQKIRREQPILFVSVNDIKETIKNKEDMDVDDEDISIVSFTYKEVSYFPNHLVIEPGNFLKNYFSLNDFDPKNYLKTENITLNKKYKLNGIVASYKEKKHAVSFVNIQDVWYECDDLKPDIKPIEQQEILNLVNNLENKNIYVNLLFYEQKESQTKKLVKKTPHSKSPIHKTRVKKRDSKYSNFWHNLFNFYFMFV